MFPCIEIVETIDDKIELAIKLNSELRVFYVCMVCLYLEIGGEAFNHLTRNLCFRLSDVRFIEEELPVQIADIDRIKINLDIAWE